MQKRVFAICASLMFVCVALTGCEVIPTETVKEEWITVHATANAMAVYYPLKANLDPDADLFDPFDKASAANNDLNYVAEGIVIFEFSVGGGRPQTAVSEISAANKRTDTAAVTLKVWQDQDVVITAHLEGNPIDKYPWWAQYGADSKTITWNTLFTAIGEKYEEETSCFAGLTLAVPTPGSVVP